IYQNTLAAVRTLLEKAPGARTATALSITNQRETFVLFDRETGAPLHNAIVWQCRRGEAICSTLSSGEAGTANQELVKARTGLRIDTYFPAAKLRWLLDNCPDLRAKLAAGDALFGTIDTYLIYRLTAGAVYATDATNASRTLFFDIDKLAWSDDLLALFGVSMGRLPEVREPSARFGETTLEGLLSAPIPICGVMGDS